MAGTEVVTPAEIARRMQAKASKGRRKFNNKPTDCSRGHRHPSKVEQRVCEALSAEAEAAGATLHHQVRLPLFAVAPNDDGRSLYMTIDFAWVEGGKLTRLIDAKSGRRRSRDWERGKRALQATMGMMIEEMEA